MAFTSPYTFVTGVVVAGTDMQLLDVASRKAINQDTAAADLADETFDYDSIQAGEYDSINNHHQFTTGETYGQFSDTRVVDRAYFTSETKPYNQTGAAYIQWQTLWHTGDRVVLEEPGAVFVTFSGGFTSNNNSTTSGGDGPGLWDSKVLLRVTDIGGVVSYIEGTRAYSFEQTSAASAGAFDPGANGIAAARFISFQWMITGLSAGTYQFCVVVNPKVEQGFAGARSFTIEVFYT